MEGRIVKGIDLPPIKKHDYRIPKLEPLTKIYRSSVLGLPVNMFPLVTGLRMEELHKKLIPNRFLITVKKGRNVFILKDYYWSCLLEYLKHSGKQVYVKKRDYKQLKNVKLCQN